LVINDVSIVVRQTHSDNDTDDITPQTLSFATKPVLRNRNRRKSRKRCSPFQTGSLDDTFNAKPFFEPESAGYGLPSSRAGMGWG
ncbi:MAG: hypothetical protein K8L97_13570, partial [Anaerolineae bacterium]|nr:hypothetical protein [Anaerolineae bacterium]